MRKIAIILVALLLTGVNAYAQDVSIDEDGNLSTGTSNSYGNLKVTGESGEHAVVGETSGTGAAGVYGKSTTSSNVGALGTDAYGVYGNSSTGNAGYFEGDARVTGNLTVDGTLSGETDPTVAASVKDGVDWTELTGIPEGFADGVDNTGGTGVWTESGSNIYFNTGNVGIGTASPAGNLDVNGSLCLGGTCRTTWPTGTGAFTDTGSLAYYNNGNVGIGTSTPSSLNLTDTKVLHLIQPVGTLDYTATGMRVEIADQAIGGISSAYRKSDGAAGIFVGAISNHRLGFITNSMEKMTLATNGYLGIDTTSPLQPLHVQGNAFVSGALGIGVASPTNDLQVSGSNALLSSDTGNFRLAISKKLATDSASIDFQDNFSGHAEIGLIGDNHFRIKVSSDGELFYDAMTIDYTNGHVGIGTSDSGATLKVLRTAPGAFALYTESIGDNTVALFAEKDGIGTAALIAKYPGESGYALHIMHAGSDPVLLIQSGPFESQDDIMVVGSDGNVAIGPAAATARVDVQSSTGYDQLRMRTPYTPTGTADTNGNVGDIAWDENYMYVKTSAGWKRSALSTW